MPALHLSEDLMKGAVSGSFDPVYMLDAYENTNLVFIMYVGPVWFSILGLQMVELAVYPYCSGVGSLYGLYEIVFIN